MKYKVAYSKMGETFYDTFDDWDTAKKDYEIKLKLDKEMIFDDRFVIGIYEEVEGNLKMVLDRVDKR